MDLGWWHQGIVVVLVRQARHQEGFLARHARQIVSRIAGCTEQLWF
jgi:hypothetical protein